jgi:hypothetical protein
MCNSPAVQSQPLIFIKIAFFIYFPKNWTVEMFTGPPPVKIKLEGIHSLLERRSSHVQFTCSAITTLNIYYNSPGVNPFSYGSTIFINSTFFW